MEVKPSQTTLIFHPHCFRASLKHTLDIKYFRQHSVEKKNQHILMLLEFYSTLSKEEPELQFSRYFPKFTFNVEKKVNFKWWTFLESEFR